MVPARIAKERFHPLFNRRGGNHSVLLRERDHLVAARFNSARLMNGNVTGLGGQNPFAACKNRVNRDGVGLRAALEEEDAGLRRPAGLTDEAAGIFGKLILAVARRRNKIGFLKTFKNRRKAAFLVVASKKFPINMKAGSAHWWKTIIGTPLLSFSAFCSHLMNRESRVNVLPKEKCSPPTK